MSAHVLPFSPPVRWGLLDFMYAVLLLLLVLVLLLLLLLLLLFFLLFASSSSSSSPDVNMDLQIAVGSAGPQQRAPDCSGQRRTSTAGSRFQRAAPDLNRGALERTGQRTSTGGLWSGLGNAGPHPGTSRAEWAAPDLSCQKICQKMCQKNVRKECQKKCQKICQKKCQKICQKI